MMVDVAMDLSVRTEVKIPTKSDEDIGVGDDNNNSITAVDLSLPKDCDRSSSSRSPDQYRSSEESPRWKNSPPPPPVTRDCSSPSGDRDPSSSPGSPLSPGPIAN